MKYILMVETDRVVDYLEFNTLQERVDKVKKILSKLKLKRYPSTYELTRIDRIFVDINKINL